MYVLMQILNRNTQTYGRLAASLGVRSDENAYCTYTCIMQHVAPVYIAHLITC